MAKKIIIILLMVSQKVFCESLDKYKIEIDNHEIAFIGLTKTDSNYAKNIFLNCYNETKYRKSEPKDKLQQCIYNSKLFSSVKITENTQGFEILVKEKWSLIPVPFYQGGSGRSNSAGLYIVDTNFLGKRKLLILGGSTGNQGAGYIFRYQDKSVFLSQWIFGLSGSNSATDIIQIEGQDEINGYTHLDSSYSLNIGYRFGKISPSMSLSQSDSKFEQISPYELPSNYRTSSIKFGNRIDYSQYKLFYQDGFRAKLEISSNVSRSDKFKKKLSTSIQIDYGLAAFTTQALTLHLNAGSSKNGRISEIFKFGGKKGFRGIETKSLWTDSYIATSIQHHIPILYLSFGTTTISPFIDYGMYKPHREGSTMRNYRAVGIGAYLFLKKIAIPGLGVLYGSNNRFQKQFVNFSIGMSI